MRISDRERILRDHKKQKIKILRDMCIKLTDADIERINSCENERAVDNVARIIILSRWG